ncbi:hypothetical protein DAPPUDRAFT_119123 [Daphnia pulex]|uniref:Uncharacterized protein n=1 Tax=Daphnia pulex TaxID=6669 RepID=E9HXI9_DAPPU|nr:hypothetical protein DAPPUDRAFT_119123 [Daphnia pulex]|eukprot:EFX63542.1 hypothetical protein DAPPUDRAFT_119123 [Daphnia pulex]
MDCLTCKTAFKKGDQKLACAKCAKWEHRRCHSWISKADYQFQKEMGFICSLCRLRDTPSPFKDVSSASKNTDQSRPKRKINKPTPFTPSPARKRANRRAPHNKATKLPVRETLPTPTPESRQHPNPSANQLHVIRPQSLYIPDQEIKTEKMLARSRKGFITLDCTTCSFLDCLFSLVNSLAASSLKIWSRCQFSFGTILSCQKPFYSDLLEEKYLEQKLSKEKFTVLVVVPRSLFSHGKMLARDNFPFQALLVQWQLNVRPADVEEGFSQVCPLIYHYGYKEPGMNGQGYQMLIHAAKAFEVDLIIVLDQERLYNELVRDLPETVKVVFQPKSGGMPPRTTISYWYEMVEKMSTRIFGYEMSGTRISTQKWRSCGTESACKSRISRSENSRIFLRIQFYPHSFELRFSDVKIFKIGAPALPDSLMPLGMKAEDQLTKLVTVQPSQQLLHHLISISMTESGEDNIIQTNVNGFICVNNVDLERQMLTVLSPQPRPLPRTRLLLSDIQYMDSH